MMGVAINIVHGSEAIINSPSVASDSSHCHPPDSVLDTNILLFHAICPSLCSSNKEEIERMYRYFAGCHAPELIAATKFKTTKINFGGPFRTFHEN